MSESKGENETIVIVIDDSDVEYKYWITKDKKGIEKVYIEKTSFHSFWVNGKAYRRNRFFDTFEQARDYMVAKQEATYNAFHLLAEQAKKRKQLWQELKEGETSVVQEKTSPDNSDDAQQAMAYLSQFKI